MLVCDACDKGYHTFCLQPAMDSLPSDPWKCRVSPISLLLWYTHTPMGQKPTERSSETGKKVLTIHQESEHVFTCFSDLLPPFFKFLSEVSCLYGVWCPWTGAAGFGPVV